MDNGDRTIADLKANLMWLNKPKWFPVIPYDKTTDCCKNLSYSNISDWRLPAAKDLVLIDIGDCKRSDTKI